MLTFNSKVTVMKGCLATLIAGLLLASFSSYASDPSITLSYSEMRRQTIKKKKLPYFGTVIDASEKVSTKMSLTVGMKVDALNPGVFSDLTEFSIDLRDPLTGNTLDIDVLLGDAHRFKPGATSVKINRHAGKAVNVKLFFKDNTMTLAYKGHTFFVSPQYLNKSNNTVSNRPAGEGTALGFAIMTVNFAGISSVVSVPYTVNFKNMPANAKLVEGFVDAGDLWRGKVEVDATVP